MLSLLFFFWLAADTTAADQLFRAGRLAEASAAYRQVLATNPDSVEALLGVGQSLLLLGKPREALPFLDRAARLQPDAGEVQLALARSLLATGSDMRAMLVLQALTRKEPSNIAALRSLALLLYRQGAFRKALAELDQLQTLKVDDLELQRIRAESLAGAGDTVEAEAACRKLLDAQPNTLDPELTLTYVRILYESGRYDAAMPYVDKVAAQQPNDPLAPLWKARLLLRKGDLEGAAKEGERSVALAPAVPFAHSVLLEVYRRAGRAREMDEQLQWLRQANESRR